MMTDFNLPPHTLGFPHQQSLQALPSSQASPYPQIPQQQQHQHQLHTNQQYPIVTSADSPHGPFVSGTGTPYLAQQQQQAFFHPQQHPQHFPAGVSAVQQHQLPSHQTRFQQQPTPHGSFPGVQNAQFNPNSPANKATPSRHISPYAAPQQQNNVQQSQSPALNQQPGFSQPPTPQSMPAPSQTPKRQNSQQQVQQTPQGQSSQQPLQTSGQQGQQAAQSQQPGTKGNMAAPPIPRGNGAQEREKERVALILEINSELLQESVELQEAGKAGAVIAPTPQEIAAGKPQEKRASPQFVDCMRRLQANLAYVAATSERSSKNPNAPVPPGPAIMDPPTWNRNNPANNPPSARKGAGQATDLQHQQLISLYQRLAKLFPGWRGQVQRTNSGPGATGAASGMVAPGQGQMQNKQMQPGQQAMSGMNMNMGMMPNNMNMGGMVTTGSGMMGNVSAPSATPHNYSNMVA